MPRSFGIAFRRQGKDSAIPDPQNQAAPGGAVAYSNPTGLIRNDAFTRVVSVTGPVKTIYLIRNNLLRSGNNRTR